MSARHLRLSSIPMLLLVAATACGGGTTAPTIFSQIWDELSPNYRTLWHPGPTNVERRAFGSQLGLARRFGFAFTEFNASAKAMTFRVTAGRCPISTSPTTAPSTWPRVGAIGAENPPARARPGASPAPPRSRLRLGRRGGALSCPTASFRLCS
jgi:hypothetical protein